MATLLYRFSIQRCPTDWVCNRKDTTPHSIKYCSWAPRRVLTLFGPNKCNTKQSAYPQQMSWCVISWTQNTTGQCPTWDTHTCAHAVHVFDVCMYENQSNSRAPDPPWFLLYRHSCRQHQRMWTLPLRYLKFNPTSERIWSRIMQWLQRGHFKAKGTQTRNTELRDTAADICVPCSV